MAEVLPIISTILASINSVLTSTNTVVTSINVVSTLGRENQRLKGKIEGKLQRLKSEVEMLKSDMEKYEAADQGLRLLMHELLCDIDDFTSALSIPEKDTAFNSLMARDSRPLEIERIEDFLERVKSIEDRQKNISEQGNVVAATDLASASTPFYAPEDDLQGFPNTKNDFMELLSPAHGGKLRVISIVGCGGVGKTALARVVYEVAEVQPSPPTTEIQGATETTPTEIHQPLAANQATLVQPSPPTTETHGATETTPPTEIYEASPVQPSPLTTEIHEPIAFNCKAWIEASMCKDSGDLLNKVLNQLDPLAAGGNDTAKAITEFLLDKRYMVIIDDLRSCSVQWKDIEHVFPKNDKDSRIIVTTRVHSIARDYSSGSYYVYPMQCLGEANSEGLFWKKVFGPTTRTPSAPEFDRSRNILSKCDGLPLALISAGNYLFREDSQHPHLSEYLCSAVCGELDNIVESKLTTFGEMKRMFAQCYNSLTDYDHKKCLLYLSIYPRGHEINSKGVARRLKAEGLVDEGALAFPQTKKKGALACWKELIDNSMIEPSPIRKTYSDAKRCKVQGMMLEFTIHNSISRNFVTLVEDGVVRVNKSDKVRSDKVRRLTIQFRSTNEEEGSSSFFEGRSYSSTKEEERINLIPQGIDPSTVRSLTIFKSKHPAEINVNEIDFKSYKMMRVLDLEGCKGLGDTVLDGICELLLLNYLNLKNTDVESLPTNMKKLKRLETLDIRQTWVKKLPVEVMMLPELAHLFGEFELPQLSDNTDKKELINFLRKISKLETLGGIVIKETKGFETVIRHATNLKKVKICGAKHTAASATRSTLWPALGACFGFSRGSNPMPVTPNGSASDLPPAHLVASTKCARILVSSLRKRSTTLASISIDSSVISKAFLESDQKTSSMLSSIKLRGPLTSLRAHTFKNLTNLNKLHLFATGLSSKQLVEALQSLDRLEYLKLGKEDSRGSWGGDFYVQSGGFPALRELCFEGPKKYPRVRIVQEAMSLLTSLQLLCEKSPPTGAEAIENHPSPRHLMRVEGIEHLKYLDEVILHSSADDETVQAWKEAAKNHTNMPCVNRLPAQPPSNAA